MSYPVAPSRRIPYDADGSGCMHYNSGSSTPSILYDQTAWALSTYGTTLNGPGGYKIRANTSGSNNYGTYSLMFGCLFIEEMDVDAAVFVGYSYQALDVAISYDTTNLNDGNWTQVDTELASGLQGRPVGDYYRTRVKNLTTAWQNVRGFRFLSRSTSGSNDSRPGELHSAHLYGAPSAGQNPHKILWLDDTGVEFARPWDWGDVERGQTLRYETFRIKNNSATLQANTLQITAEDLNGSSGTYFEFSDDGVSYSPTLQITSLAAQESMMIYVKYDVPAGAAIRSDEARWRCTLSGWEEGQAVGAASEVESSNVVGVL